MRNTSHPPAAHDAKRSFSERLRCADRGFPNLKLFKHGKEIAEYPGQREVESIVGYVEK